MENSWGKVGDMHGGNFYIVWESVEREPECKYLLKHGSAWFQVERIYFYVYWLIVCMFSWMALW